MTRHIISVWREDGKFYRLISALPGRWPEVEMFDPEREKWVFCDYAPSEIF